MKKRESKTKITLSKSHNAKSKGLHGAIFDGTTKKLTPASVGAQKAWQGFPLGLKKEFRKSLKDSDRDGVPNGFDCRPKNKHRQEGFLPDDAAYVKTMNSVKLGEYVGGGSVGEIYNIEGNPNLVVKVPNGIVSGNHDYSKVSRKRLFKEWSQSDSVSANRQPLMIPSKAVKLTDYGTPSDRVYGLVRPKVTPIWKVKPSLLTPSLIEQIRQKVIKLSSDGFMFKDGLQLGLDRASRPLIYDLGDVELANNVSQAYRVNNDHWENFIWEISLEKVADVGSYDYIDLFGNKRVMRQ